MITQNRTYSRVFYFLIAIILAIGIFFRFTNLSNKIYWIDEVHTTLRVAGYEKVEFAETAPSGKIIGINELHNFQRLNPERGWGDTMNALAHNAEHTPIYYLLTRLAMQWFGSSTAVTRGVAAGISLLVFPSIYWLCLELFRSPIVGAIAMSLVAVSPLHILYAQEARQYSLFTVTILISSIALLKALPRQEESSSQKKNWGNWGIYAATVSFNLYSHLISLLVVLGHGIYILILHGRKQFFKYLIALGLGLMSLTPWIVLYFLNSNKIGGWIARDISLGTLVQRWFINLTTVFFDLHVIYKQRIFDVETGQDMALNSGNVSRSLMLLIFIFVGYCLYFLCRHRPKPVWLFVLTLMGTTGLALMLPDIISGGQRSGIARYLIPCYLGIQLAVADAIAHHITPNITPNKNRPVISVNPLQQKLWQGIFISLITLGIISSSMSMEAETWWHKYSSYYNPEVAQIINQTDRPLVISSQKRVSRITSLSYKLNPEVKILLIKNRQIPAIDGAFKNLFVFRPSAELYQAFEENPNYQLIPAHPFGHLFKLQRLNG